MRIFSGPDATGRLASRRFSPSITEVAASNHSGSKSSERTNRRIPSPRGSPLNVNSPFSLVFAVGTSWQSSVRQSYGPSRTASVPLPDPPA